MAEAVVKGSKIEYTQWRHHEAVQFSAGGYDALVIPDVGANVIMLKDQIRALDLLRTPDEEVTYEAFKERPQLYGIPVLFPPNRIEDGRFSVNGRHYQFPINEQKKNNHIHGFLRNVNWSISELSLDKECVSISLRYENNSKSDFYCYFPHRLSAILTYKLSSAGLYQTLEIVNEDHDAFPLGTGFHTAFNVPFHKDSRGEDYCLIASVGDKWELNNRSLPTGALLIEELDFREKGIHPQMGEIDSLYSIQPLYRNGNLFNGAILEDRKQKVRLVYEMGEKYKFMMIWNAGGNQQFICLEPQSWAINAPNLHLSADITGYYLLKPKERWSESCRIYTESLE